ncbi:hypothetical protein F5X98DRAFT_359961 [Xylaria grammica]|nr:hypothetical protein F5X98DRAFT_359961 [Xylaria grammica]
MQVQLRYSFCVRPEFQPDFPIICTYSLAACVRRTQADGVSVVHCIYRVFRMTFLCALGH